MPPPHRHGYSHRELPLFVLLLPTILLLVCDCGGMPPNQSPSELAQSQAAAAAASGQRAARAVRSKGAIPSPCPSPPSSLSLCGGIATSQIPPLSPWSPRSGLAVGMVPPPPCGSPLLPRLLLRGGRRRDWMRGGGGGGGGVEEADIEVSDDPDLEAGDEEDYDDDETERMDDDDDDEMGAEEAERADKAYGEFAQEIQAEKLLPQLEGMGLKIKIKKEEQKGGMEDKVVKRLMTDLETHINGMSRDDRLRHLRKLRDSGELQAYMRNITSEESVAEMLIALDERWDKLPEVEIEGRRQARMAARRRLYGYSWSKDEDEMLQRRLEQLAKQSQGGDTIAVPSMSPTVQEAIELCMETGQKVVVGAGVTSDWEPESLAILPNSTVKIEGASPAGSMMRGTWECMEVSRVGISKLNVSVGGETEDTVTILVRGAHVSMEHCDMRCVGGTVMRLHNGRFRELDVAPNFMPSILELQVDDETGAQTLAPPTLPSFVSLVECGIGGFDPSKREGGRGKIFGAQRLAQSCIDLFDDCVAEVRRCTLTDCDGCISRAFDTSYLKLDHVYAALSRNGVFAAEYATVDAQDSCIEFISLGGGLRLEDKVYCKILRCDIRECIYGICMSGACTLEAESCALINNTFSAYNLLPADERDEVPQDVNVTLVSNKVHVYMGSVEWYGGRKPQRLSISGSNEFFDHTRGLEELLARGGRKHVTEDDEEEVRKLCERVGMKYSELREGLSDLGRREGMGEAEALDKELTDMWERAEGEEGAAEAREWWDAIE